MLSRDKKLFIARAGDLEIDLNPAMANRHGLIAGATGTGKTVSLTTLAESFSALGVPVFLTDIKGDLAGLSQKGEPQGGLAERVEQLALKEAGYENKPYPVCFWDISGESGHPLRATVSSLGPLLFSRLLSLNEVQSGLMHALFKMADDRGLLLLDLKDLRSLVQFAGENRKDLTEYGNISQASLGAIQRGLLRLEEEGGENFFGEPALDLPDILRPTLDGRGLIHILAAHKLIHTPRLYAAILLWLLSELFEELPEVGDLDKPRLVLMFDEAHTLFADAPAVLVDKIEQVVRLIRSKGVGVYFITQSPSDIPDSILAQLGNRIQHALRAFTPKDQKAVKAAAQTFRPNPEFKTEEAITNLNIGEALISFLDRKGAPGITQRALVLPPESRTGAISPEERSRVMAASPFKGKYDQAIDRESAYELLSRQFARRQAEAEAQEEAKEEARRRKEAEAEERARLKNARSSGRSSKKEKDIFGSAVESFAKQASRTIGRELGTKIIRGLMGGIFGGKKK